MLRKRFALLAILVIMTMVLASCGGGNPTPVPATATTGPAAAATDTTAPAAEPTDTAAAEPTETEAMAGETPTQGAGGGDKPLAGKTVTIFGVAADEQARLFQSEFDAFTERTGIKVVYEGNKDFETLILVRVEGNNAPDIAQFAQPGLLADFVRKGNAIDLNTVLDKSLLEKQYTPAFLELATVDGKMAGLWHNNDVKSLVWYPKKAFDAKGYKVPTTWDEMVALSDQIVADGGNPWCIGIESAGATGWVGTDWVEDVMLRTTSPENYDKWTRGELKFNSPEVKAAFDKVGQIWFKDKYVYGGVPTILTTAFGDAVNPLFENPPKCWLHRQASFITNFFPETAKVGEDIAYFYLPPIDPAYGKPVLGSGSISAMFNNRPEVVEVMKFLATGESMKTEAQAGVAVAPHKDADPSWYPNEATRGFAQILQNATTFRFDGSDLMPSAVGAGSFWTGIVDWVGAEGQNTDQVLQNIDASWPSQ
ncbi:MAG: ABC transporter substrate-binding protein [Chloroflexota bacterium]|nr:ABC transporter substrate-binding protein [Chloroflexota bacterium]